MNLVVNVIGGRTARFGPTIQGEAWTFRWAFTQAGVLAAATNLRPYILGNSWTLSAAEQTVRPYEALAFGKNYEL